MKESSYEMKCFHVSAIGKDERKKSKFYILRFCKILEFLVLGVYAQIFIN